MREVHAAGQVPRAGSASGLRSRRLAGLRDALALLAMAVCLALLVRTFVVEPFRIPSESMLPTLVVGDHLFVDKLSYGARVPFSARRLPAWRDPARGEVVVFYVGRIGAEVAPVDRRPGLARERFVKRIVGVPGDRVELRGGALFVNGAAARRGTARPGAGAAVRAGERLGERDYATLRQPAQAAPQEDGVWRVEPGRYFVMGDNREESHDSRRFGTIPRDDIEGPAILLYWSLAGPQPSSGAGRGLALLPERIRWDRIGARVR